ncbi:MAG TPA: hypothetical protein PK771_04195 [Spirochaetota bacterium]|nr:hypothetical protein [Spirochaetota bacterium]
MKNLYLIIFILFLLSCQSKMVREVDAKTEATVFKEEEKKIQKKGGFKYDVPPHMEKDPEAHYYRYDDLLVEKGKNVFDSSIVIAIRKTIDYNGTSVLSFAQSDQSNMRQSVRNVNYESNWDADSLNNKGIDHISFEFSYIYDKKKIYQRSVYIKYYDTFYIISLSSKNKEELYKDQNILFWNTISVD